MTDIVPSTGGAHGVGLATYAADGRVLDAWYLHPERTAGGGAAGTVPVSAGALEDALGGGAARAVGR
ncbi:MAG: 2,3,4,5-tetrahydropyridine-2,6-dicarboxylate N-succinyltransferase, partial [Acidimicrobiales bacterium]